MISIKSTDPICFLLHKRNVLYNFHFQRVNQTIQQGKKWENPISLGNLINLAGTEVRHYSCLCNDCPTPFDLYQLESQMNQRLFIQQMHTNNAMLRHFWWATNALWPSDLDRNNIPAAVLVSEKDEIVPSADVEQIFSDYENGKVKEGNNANRWNVFSNSSANEGVMLKAKMLHGASHGEFAFDESHRKKVVKSVLAMMRLNSISEKKKMLDKTNNASLFSYPSFEFTSPASSFPLWKTNSITGRNRNGVCIFSHVVIWRAYDS